MDEFDIFGRSFLPRNDEKRVSSDVRRAFIRNKQSILRDESETWHHVFQPKFARMAEQLRVEAEQCVHDAHARLELALYFHELARFAPPETPESGDFD